MLSGRQVFVGFVLVLVASMAMVLPFYSQMAELNRQLDSMEDHIETISDLAVELHSGSDTGASCERWLEMAPTTLASGAPGVCPTPTPTPAYIQCDWETHTAGPPRETASPVPSATDQPSTDVPATPIVVPSQTPKPAATQPNPTATEEPKGYCNRGLGNGSESCDPGNSPGKPGKAGESDG